MVGKGNMVNGYVFTRVWVNMHGFHWYGLGTVVIIYNMTLRSTLKLSIILINGKLLLPLFHLHTRTCPTQVHTCFTICGSLTLSQCWTYWTYTYWTYGPFSDHCLRLALTWPPP